MRLSETRPPRTLPLLALLFALLALPACASGPVTGTYPVVWIRVSYTDSSATVWSRDTLQQGANEMTTFFRELSYGQLEVPITVREAALPNNVAHYWHTCPGDPAHKCQEHIVEDAAARVIADGGSFAGVKTVQIINPCGIETDFTEPGDVHITGSGFDVWVHQTMDFECGPAGGITPGPAGVWWNGWAHELGHTIQLQGHNLFDHPAGYASGYDLMDSCYPCHDSVYSLSGNPIVGNMGRTSFPGWLPTSKVTTVNRPPSGVTGATVVLEPLEKADPGATPAPRGIKIPINSDHYYIVEARRRVLADTRSGGPGIMDEGVHILDVIESRNPPVRLINACDSTVSGGCVNATSDPRYGACLSASGHYPSYPGYCWPFQLFHAGEQYYDATNSIRVRTDSVVGDAFSVTVTRGVPPGHPDVMMIPWLTAPMNTWETIDIWVDSSCNGYEDTVGAAGLRYGRRPDGTVIGNGDDPCANHENRIYAHVRNGGDAPANSISVHFYVTDPLGVGISGASGWTLVGTAPIPSLAPGATRDVYVNWTPAVTLTEAQIHERHFNFHSCVQVKIDAVAGEMVLSNQDGDGEQENFDNFEAVRDPITTRFNIPERSFFLSNRRLKDNPTGGMSMGGGSGERLFKLRVDEQLPPGWDYQIAGGNLEQVLAANEVRNIPVKITVPDGTEIGHTYMLKVTAFTPMTMVNPLVPATDPVHHQHFGFEHVAGVMLAAQTVDPSKLTITAEWKCPDTAAALTHVPPASIHVKGKLEPARNNVIIAIDYTPPSGPVVTHLVHTNSAGEFEDTLNNPAAGTWKVRAFWQGNMDLAGAVSDEQSVSPRDCNKKPEQQQPTTVAQLPPGSTILLPPDSFPGGVLTGVVIGPDDKPVPNTPVNIAGGVPTELTGVVIGEEPPARQKPPERQPCVPDANGNLPPGCPPSRQKPPSLPAVNAPQDCASVLSAAQGILRQPVNQATDHILIGLLQPDVTTGVIGPTMDTGEGNTYLSQNGGGVTTDANGRFALCVKPDAKGVDVTSPDGSVKSSVPATGNPPGGNCEQPPQFYQAASNLNFCKLLSKPTLEQGGQTWLLPAVQAISPKGDRVLTSVRTPRDLQPGEATLSFLDRTGQKRSFTGGVFKIVSASLDRNKLRSNEGADFDYEVAFSPQWGGKQLCVNVTTSGPITLVQPPPPQLDVNGDGHASIKGKIRATQVAPGAAVPFVIRLNVSQCGPGPQNTGEKDPGPAGVPGARDPGPSGDTEMKLSLTPGPVSVNPFVKQDNKDVAVPPRTVAMTPPVPDLSGPEHTMDSTNKYAKAPAPISGCKLQTKTPVITSVEGVQQPTVFTQQQGLNYFTVHGCNFGSTPGHVYLVFHPDSGPGFPTPVELYLNTGNNPWGPDSIAVYLNPSFGGYLDQTGLILRVVTAKGLTAELPHQVFHAERVDGVIAWLPRSQVALGATSDPLTPVFKTTGASQTDSLLIVGGGNRGDTMTATVARTISNVGAPFTVQDDMWDFSALRPGFVVKYATPYFEAWNGSGCTQTAGKWGTQWDSATELRIHVQGCFHSGTGSWRTSTAQYGLQIELRGPKGVLPWPSNLH